MYINEEAEQEAASHGWTYETGYNQGREMGYLAQADRNYFPKHTYAWWGHKEGYKDGKKARKRGYR